MGKSTYRVFVARKKMEETDHEEKYRGTWEDNIKLDIKEIEMKVLDWIHPARLL
jgi:hypothetical protein